MRSEAGCNLGLGVFFVVAKLLINALRETSVKELLIRGYSVGSTTTNVET
jgi:hypothetical protein